MKLNIYQWHVSSNATSYASQPAHVIRLAEQCCKQSIETWMFSSWKLQSDCCLIFTECYESLRPVSSTTTPQKQAHNKPSLSVLPSSGTRDVLTCRPAPGSGPSADTPRLWPPAPPSGTSFFSIWDGWLCWRTAAQRIVTKTQTVEYWNDKLPSVSSKKKFSTSRNFEKTKKTKLFCLLHTNENINA